MSRGHHERRQQQAITQPDPVIANIQKLQQQAIAEANAVTMRLNVAAQIMAQLVGVEYMAHLQGSKTGDFEPAPLAALANASAFALMVEAGILKVVEQKPVEPEANGEKTAESSIILT